MKKKFLTTKEVSERTGIPCGTLHNLAYQKKGPPFYKVGRKRFYEVEIIDKFIKSNPVLTKELIDGGAR